MPLNIYLVSRPKEKKCSYDQYEKAVIICQDEEMARRIHPNGVSILDINKMQWSHAKVVQVKCEFGFSMDLTHSDTWIEPEEYMDLVVTHIGVANSGAKKGVVLANFVEG